MPKFCPECGAAAEGMKFCPECGASLDDGSSASAVAAANSAPVQNQNAPQGEQVILEFGTELLVDLGRKNIVGDLSVGQSKNVYTLTTDRLISDEKGLIKGKRNEIELYRLKDVSVKQGVTDKVRSIGQITVTSTDPSDPTMVMKQIKNPVEVADAIKAAARTKKQAMNIMYRQDL